MLKIFLRVVSNDGRFFNGALHILERQHNGLELVGVTAGAPIQLNQDSRKVPFVPLNEVDRGGAYDVLLVVGAKKIGMSDVTKAAAQLHLPAEKLLGDWIVCIPGFTLDKYRRLQRSRLSIISRQCFGGCVSNMLGLPFRSPLVNLFVLYEDFLKFLRAPKVYLESEPHFERLTSTSQEAPDGYPLLSLADISLNMMHYKTPEDALAKWNERKHRINWYNLAVIASFNEEEFLEQFDALPYGKKICFVPFKSNLDSAWYIPPEKIEDGKPLLGGNVNNFGWGKIFYYDLFDMLLYGKKTPLIKM